MSSRPDWKARVLAHARNTGAPDLAQHTLDELAAHLEDIYLEARRAGRPEAEAMRVAEGALAESPLGTVPVSRTRRANRCRAKSPEAVSKYRSRMCCGASGRKTNCPAPPALARSASTRPESSLQMMSAASSSRSA